MKRYTVKAEEFGQDIIRLTDVESRDGRYVLYEDAAQALSDMCKRLRSRVAAVIGEGSPLSADGVLAVLWELIEQEEGRGQLTTQPGEIQDATFDQLGSQGIQVIDERDINRTQPTGGRDDA